MGLRDDEKAGLSDEELEALDDVEEGGHVDANEGDEGDDDEGDGSPGAVAAEGDGAPASDAGDGADPGGEAAAPAGEDGAPAGEAAGAGEAEPATLQPPPAALITVPEVGDYEAERGTLLDERKDLRQKHRDGDISTDEYEDQLDTLNDKIALLDRRKADHDHAIEQNAAVQRAQYAWTIEQVKKDFKATDGVDYDKNPTLMAMWDREVRTLAAKEEFASKPAEWFLREGHKAVLAEVSKVAESLGFAKGKAIEPKPKETPKESVKEAVKARLPDVPLKGVGNLPPASAEPVGTDEFSDLDNLSGLELEKALARMPEERQAKYLRG
jgi:hypothetical protein